MEVASRRITTNATNAAPLKHIAWMFRSEKSVFRCLLVISASLGCFQLPGLSVKVGVEACLTGVNCPILVVAVETAEETLVVVAESAEEDIAAVGKKPTLCSCTMAVGLVWNRAVKRWGVRARPERM